MRRKNLFLTIGVPGSGKSTWLKENCQGVIVSRDEIRFALLNEGDDYFSKENEVFETFIKTIQNALDNEEGPVSVFVDATHLNKASRDRVLNALDLSNVEHIHAIFFDVSTGTCIERNDLRTGRAFVPKSVIKRMATSLEMPTFKERFEAVLIVNKEGLIMEVETFG